MRNLAQILRNPAAGRLLCALFALLVVASAALAGSRYSVTATISSGCCDANSNSYTLQGDGAGTYSNGGSLLSQITPNNGPTNYYQWSFDLSNSSRSFNLTLTPVNGSPAGPFAGPMPFNGQLYSRCFTPSLGLQNWTQIVTSDNNCAMRANFSYGGVGYSLVMSPQVSGTGTATVTCTSNSSPCSSWSDLPTTGPNASNPNVANLYNGGTLVGQYYLSFNISLSHP